MKRSKKLISGLAFAIALIMVLSAMPMFFAADNAKESETELFSSIQALGARFEKGINRDISAKKNLDSKITNVKIFKSSNNYRIDFSFNSESFKINGELVEAKMNNSEKDHYVFAPINFSNQKYSLLNIKLTTNANKFDLLPANQDMIGKTVVTIVMKEKQTNDTLYWQSELESKNDKKIILYTTSSEEAVTKANEYYYMTSVKSTEDVWSESTDGNREYASREIYEELKNKRMETKAELYDSNPYDYLGIPDSSFKTVTDKWQWLGVGPIPDTNTYLPLRYYAYSYAQPGAPQNICTHIMIIGRVDEMPTTSTTITSNGKKFSKATAMIKMEIYEVPHTVVYYTREGKFEFMLGGENLTQIPEPSVRIRKTSNGVKHVLTGRYSFSNATKKNYAGALILRSAVVELLDKNTYGITSKALDIVDIINKSNMSVGANDGYVPIEEYSPDYDYQINMYGEAMGSVKHKVKGYLRTKGQYLGTRAWFAVPYADRASATKLTWVYYVSIEMR